MFEPLSGDERAMAETTSGNDYKFIEQLPDNHQGRYAYRNAKSKLLWVIQRYYIDGKKTFGNYMPADKKGVQGWVRGKGVPIPNKDRPLYGLVDLLKADPARQVMVVEGEKCRNAVARHYKKVVAVSWMGGGMAWQKTDWSPLYGRSLILVADGDEPGHKVMKALAAHLHPHCPDIRLVLPPIADGGLDIADEIESKRGVNAWLEKHVQTYEPDGMSPDGMSNGSPDRSPLQSPEGGNGDEWQSLIAAGKDNSGVFFEPETLSRLVALKRNRPDQWVNLRDRIKRECPNVPIQELDKMIKALLGGGARLQGHAIVWPQYVPYPNPVDGAALVRDLVKLVKTYVAMPEGGAEAVVAWALYAWVFEAFGVCPNLMISAPERESGKTRLTEMISWMVPRPQPVSDASAAAIVRGIESYRPTMLFDEAQHFLKRRPEDPIRGILLAAFTKRFAEVFKIEGDANEMRAFSTFTPKVMNGRKLANIDDMLTSRSVVIPMTRAKRQMPDLSVTHDPVGDDLRSKCARWRDDHFEALKEAKPDMSGLTGRVADVWRPLFAVADAVGGEWPHAVRCAARSLGKLTKTVADGDSLGVQLLSDIHQEFQSQGYPDRLETSKLDRALNDRQEHPWSTISNGKQMTPQKRASLLKPYGIHSNKRREGDSTVNVYLRSDLEDAWNAWLPSNTVDSEPEHRNIGENAGIRRDPKPEHGR